MDMQFSVITVGGYVEFRHEPAASGIALAVETVMQAIADDLKKFGVYTMGTVKVIYRTADDVERDRYEAALIEGFAPSSNTKNAWTVGVKVDVNVPFLAKESVIRTALHVGIRPSPILVVE